MAAQPVESRVLVIMTGGTICMKDSPQGLVPVTGFMKEAMAPRQSFNDGQPYGEYMISCYVLISPSFTKELSIAHNLPSHLFKSVGRREIVDWLVSILLLAQNAGQSLEIFPCFLIHKPTS